MAGLPHSWSDLSSGRASRNALQVVASLLAAVPVMAGLAGVVGGPGFLGVSAPWPTDLDSHARFISGLLFGVGIGWYSCVAGIERKTGRFRLLAALTVCGGLARLLSLVDAGVPSVGHLYGLVAELVVVPLLVLWQARIAQR